VPSYLDVAAVRIQTYLGRTPQLRGRRGASARLSHACLWEAVRPGINGRASRNPEAGYVDGVISLVVNTGIEPAVVARSMFTELRRLLPAAEFQAAWGSGADYATVYADQMQHQRQTGAALVDLPAVAEVPAILLCRICRLDPVVDHVKVPNDDEPGTLRPLATCADCAVRYREKRQEGPRHTLLEHLGESRPLSFLETLSDLAYAIDPPVSQVATIAIDGNRLGAVLEELATVGVSRAALVPKVTAVTLEAFTLAAMAVCCDGQAERPYTAGRLVVEPHVLGGDDVLVTVPAPLGWLFVRTMLGEFTDAGAKVVKELTGGQGNPPHLTASAGVVFSHPTEPIANLVAAADGLLRAAKRTVDGRTASVLWLDVTEEGYRAPDPRRRLLLADLDGKRPDSMHHALIDLAALTGSRRAALARVADDREQAFAEAIRTGVSDTVKYFTAGDRCQLTLRDALVLARWYR
jgi:hypothetical protein